LISTPSKRNFCAVKRATSSSLRRVRIGSDSTLLLSSSRRLKRLRSRGWISTTSARASIVLSSWLTLPGWISSV
jgi:hypothetical protein